MENQNSNSHNTMYLIAAILNWVTLGGTFLLNIQNPVAAIIAVIIMACWTVPMTIRIHKNQRDMTRKHTALGVCTLLFINIISGILILVADAQVKKEA